MFFVSRRRYDTDLADARAVSDRLRTQLEESRENAVAWHAAAVRTAEQFTDASIVNDCLTRDLVAARRRVRIARSAATRILAAYRRERSRADRLQGRLDDACGLNHPAVEAGQHWQARRIDKLAAKETSS
jgi:hypothetical protein